MNYSDTLIYIGNQIEARASWNTHKRQRPLRDWNMGKVQVQSFSSGKNSTMA